MKLFSWGEIIRIKLWEWNTGWMGLALSVASAFMVSQGLKNFGKPRPNMLARCDPNLDVIGRYNLGGYGTDISSRWVLVDQTICRQTNKAILNDGFQSWPSGHATSIIIVMRLMKHTNAVQLHSLALSTSRYTCAPSSRCPSPSPLDRLSKQSRMRTMTYFGDA